MYIIVYIYLLLHSNHSSILYISCMIRMYRIQYNAQPNETHTSRISCCIWGIRFRNKQRFLVSSVNVSDPGGRAFQLTGQRDDPMAGVLKQSLSSLPWPCHAFHVNAKHCIKILFAVIERPPKSQDLTLSTNVKNVQRNTCTLLITTEICIKLTFKSVFKVVQASRAHPPRLLHRRPWFTTKPSIVKQCQNVFADHDLTVLICARIGIPISWERLIWPYARKAHGLRDHNTNVEI